MFFRNPGELRAWLRENHAALDEAWVGMYKKATGKPSVTWPELVDQLLCFGWIDGVRHSIDAERFMNRVTPRRRGSVWSAINVKRAGELIELGLMEPPGLAAFEARDPRRTYRASLQQAAARLDEAHEARFRSHAEAWAFFQGQPPSYRKAVTHWVVSAKREETRRRRLERLVAACARGERLRP